MDVATTMGSYSIAFVLVCRPICSSIFPPQEAGVTLTRSSQHIFSNEENEKLCSLQHQERSCAIFIGEDEVFDACICRKKNINPVTQRSRSSSNGVRTNSRQRVGEIVQTRKCDVMFADVWVL